MLFLWCASISSAEHLAPSTAAIVPISTASPAGSATEPALPGRSPPEESSPPAEILENLDLLLELPPEEWADWENLDLSEHLEILVSTGSAE